MKIHAFGSEPHYREHLAAIHRHLPESIRGEMYGERERSTPPLPPSDLVLIAGYSDIAATSNRIVYVEHGAGQRYVKLDKAHAAPYYHGGEHPDRVVGYICPRQEVADRWQRPAFAVGSPICDPFPLHTGNEHPAVAITFHWMCHACPETRSALGHYQAAIEPLVEQLRSAGVVVMGHHHPRDRILPRLWRNLGVEIFTAAEVRTHADLLISDNTSLAYEMAYLGRNNLVLNAPWFRRDVEHGLRFWDAPPGDTIDGPDELLDCNVAVLIEGGWRDRVEGRAARAAYGRALNTDGRDGHRAAMWVTWLAGSL